MIKKIPDFIAAKIEMVPFSTCWYWLGSLNNSGYGQHRRVYEALVGVIPAGLDLDHLCRCKSCVNPAHLEPVTRLINLERAGAISTIKKIAAQRKEKTHCKNGHAFVEGNVYVRKVAGSRRCQACRRDYEKKRRHVSAVQAKF